MASSNSSTGMQLSRRLDVVESDLKSQSEQMATQGRQLAAVATDVASMGRTQHETSAKIDQLLARGAGTEATRGMISQQTVMWFLGLLVSICAVGFAAIGLYSSGINKNISHDAEKRLAAESTLAAEIIETKNEISRLDDETKLRNTVGNEFIDKHLITKFDWMRDITEEKLKALESEMGLRLEKLTEDIGEDREDIRTIYDKIDGIMKSPNSQKVEIIKGY